MTKKNPNYPRNSERNDFSDTELTSSTGLIAKEMRALGFRVERWSSMLVSTRDGKTMYSVESETDGNRQASGRVVKNKAWTRRVLEEAGIGIAKGRSFSVRQKKRARNFVSEIGPAVVKPKDGSKARGVTVNVTRKNFEAAWEHALENTRSGVVVEQYFSPGEEARYFLVDGKCVGVYKRLPPFVVGDGVSTVAELVEETNRAKRRNPYRRSSLIDLNEDQRTVLEDQGFSLDSVPPDGAVVVFARRAAGVGRDTVSLIGTVHPTMIALAERVAAVLPGLSVIGCDIMARDHTQPMKEGDYIVLEINTRPHIRGHHYPDFGPPVNAARKIAEANARTLGFQIPEKSGEKTTFAKVREAASEKSVTLVFAGDMYLRSSEHPSDRLGSDHLAQIEPLISDNDFFALSLRTQQPNGRRGKVEPMTTVLQCVEHIEFFHRSGVKGVSIGNRSFARMNAEEIGSIHSTFASAGISVLGAEGDLAKSSVLETSLGNVHLISFADMFGSRIQTSKTRPPQISSVGPGRQNQVLGRVQDLRVDDPNSVVIALPSWSDRKKLNWASDRAFELNTSLFKSGADFIFGSGTEGFQQCWIDDGSPAAMSLGSFSRGVASRERTQNFPRTGLIARLTLFRSSGSLSYVLRVYPTIQDAKETRETVRPASRDEAFRAFRMLKHHGQQTFDENFDLGYDERGWLLEHRGSA